MSKSKSFSINNQHVTAHFNAYNDSASEKSQAQARVQKFLCAICNEPTLLCCATCRDVFYCTPEHQKLHWETHEAECTYEYGSEKGTTTNTDLPSTITAIRDRSQDAIKREQTNLRQGNLEKKSVKPLEEEPESIELFLHDQISPEAKERRNLLKEVFRLYRDEQFELALPKARRIYELSLKLAEDTETVDFTQAIGDGLLLVKCLLNVDKISQAREVLLGVWEAAQENIKESRISILQENEGVFRTYKFAQLKDNFVSFVQSPVLPQQQKVTINEYILKITNLLSCIAALFYSIGDLVNCEEAYIKYTKVLEFNFGQESAEASNAYFLVGTFYLENRYLNKALACYRKAASIRQNHFGTEQHESIADCYYNMGLIYKQNEEFRKALDELNKASKIRANLIGEVSLPVANVLELEGKIYLEMEEYRPAFTKFRNCFRIRRRILRDAHHPDTIRASLLICNIYQKLEEAIVSNQVFLKKRETYKEILTSIKESDVYMEINQTLGIAPPEENPLERTDQKLQEKFLNIRNMIAAQNLQTGTENDGRVLAKSSSRAKNLRTEGSDVVYLQTQASSQDGTKRTARKLRDQFFRHNESEDMMNSDRKILGKLKELNNEADYSQKSLTSLKEKSESENIDDDSMSLKENIEEIKSPLKMKMQQFYPYRKDSPYPYPLPQVSNQKSDTSKEHQQMSSLDLSKIKEQSLSSDSKNF